MAPPYRNGSNIGIDVPAAVRDKDAFFSLVHDRRAALSEFLSWAASREAGSPDDSLRFGNRPDMERCRRALVWFTEPWWAVVVYSCFDSDIGTAAVADAFVKPLTPDEARSAIDGICFPLGSVQAHRTQVTVSRAKKSLVSACENAAELKSIHTTPGLTFEERFEQLERLHVWAWGRTTNFDSLARAGELKVDGVGYRPGHVHLYGSSGPRRGFERIWGVPITKAVAGICDELLAIWAREWEAVAERVGVCWLDSPYDVADLENALCLFDMSL